MPRNLLDTIHPSQNAHTKNSLYLFLPIIIFIGLQILRIAYASPEVDGHGDASLKWDLARSLAFGEGINFDTSNHHSLRWASWLLPYVLITVFGDHLTVYLLSTIIPSTIAGCIFVWLITRALGITFGILFTFIWMIDPELYTATFSLMPTGSTLLPLSILLFLAIKIVVEEKSSFFITAMLSIVCFWLYGVKETNLFFIPGIIYLLFGFTTKKHLVAFLVLGVAFYMVETIALWQFGGMNHIFGRVYELIFGSAHHLSVMGGGRITGELVKFYDQGISYRFYSGTAFHSSMYFAAAAIALIKIFEQNIITIVDKTLLAVGCIYLSFFFTTGFFVVDLDPIIPGQPLRPRYLAPMIPLAIILISIGAVKLASGKPKIILLPILAITWFWFSIPLNWASKTYTKPYTNITSMNHHYSNFASALQSTDCVYTRIKRHLSIIHRWPPLSSRGTKFKVYENTKITKLNGNIFVKQLSPTCTNNITLSGQNFKINYEVPINNHN